MKDRYVKFFKKELVFLLILLVVICFSFGVTYSNFIYNSEEFRAVEIFTGKLEYELTNNKLTIKPGNNIFKIAIKSLNEIDSYYKLVSDKNVNIKYFNKEDNIIKSNETIFIYLTAFNKENKNIEVNISALGGFTTNKYEDIKVENNQYEINDSIDVGDIVTFDNQVYKLLGINADGSYELISDVLENSIKLKGSSGYNKSIGLLNEGLVGKRVLNLEDIEKYANNKIIEYTDYSYFSDSYYPALWGLEENAIIDNEKVNALYSRSEGVLEDEEYNHASEITIKNMKINNIDFINEKYKDIFFNSNYLLATRYQESINDGVAWGILSIDNDELKLNKLFDSKMNDYEIKGKVRIIINVSSEIDLFNQSL